MKSIPSTSEWLPYLHSSCCDQTRSSENLFKRWNDERNLTINLLYEDKIQKLLWGKESPLSIDRQCLWQMGNRDINQTRGFRLSHSCPQCRNLERLTERLTDQSLIGQSFILESGPETGKPVYIETVPISSISIKKVIGRRPITDFIYQPFNSPIL